MFKKTTISALVPSIATISAQLSAQASVRRSQWPNLSTFSLLQLCWRFRALMLQRQLMQTLTYNLSLATIMVDIVTTAGTMVIAGVMGIIEVTAITVIAGIMETGTVIIAEIMAIATTVTATMVIADTMVTAIMVTATMVTAGIIGNRDHNGYW
jgi:hypothetical protein